jgi:hypothetical protein
MYTATINDFRIKQDEMLRQAENYRLIQVAQKTYSPVSRALNTLRIAINQLFSI